MRSKDFSIVIPTLNEEGYVHHLLGDLMTQTHKNFEVVVVDGGSSDGTLQVLEKFESIKVVKAKRGVARQRNAGGRSSLGRHLIFLDADMRIQKHFLEELKREIEQKNLDMLTPKFSWPQAHAVVRMVYSACNMTFKLTKKTAPSGSGACLIVDREIFVKSGGFDESLSMFDDIEFVRRVGKQARYEVIEHEVFQSDRRFRKYGVYKTTLKYMLMAVFFAVGWFRFAEKVLKYEFGRHIRG